jgi:hypothetical protein
MALHMASTEGGHRQNAGWGDVEGEHRGLTDSVCKNDPIALWQGNEVLTHIHLNNPGPGQDIRTTFPLGCRPST